MIYYHNHIYHYHNYIYFILGLKDYFLTWNFLNSELFGGYIPPGIGTHVSGGTPRTVETKNILAVQFRSLRKW